MKSSARTFHVTAGAVVFFFVLAAAALAQNPLSFSKSFTPSSIVPGQTSVLTITITNTNPIDFPLLLCSLSDVYPANLVNTASPSGSTTCRGQVFALPGDNGVFFVPPFSSLCPPFVLIAPGSCTVTVNVTSSVPGSYINTVAGASATLTVNAPIVPTLSGWGFVAMACLVALGGVWLFRRS